ARAMIRMGRVLITLSRLPSRRLDCAPMTRVFSWPGYGALLALGAALYLLCRLFPADLPLWMPWEFHWPEFLALSLTLAWFVRGLNILPTTRHPPLWRKISFLAGVLSFYVVLQTHVDYYAQ